MKSIRFGLVALALALLSGHAVAQSYPTHPVKILVTIPPGGAPDIAARLLAQRMSETIGSSFFVENRSGANGNVAADAIAKGDPDGYTLIVAADSLLTINPHVYPSLPYDPLKDLLPVSSIASNQFFLSVNPTLPVKTVPELVEYAKKAKPPLPYASGGNGSQHQLGIEMLKQRAGIDLLHVPYRGGAPAGMATVAGETMVVLAGASNAGLLRGGQLRGLATTGTKRSPLFPELPPIADYYPGYDLTIWIGLFAPPATPEPIVTKLRNEVQKILKDQDFQQKLNVTGALEPLILSPQDFSALIKRDYDKYGKLVRDVGVKIQ
ncbi:Bug family tripartite tricarboxylate transporter substrate binding protein [Rhodoplanes sp. Z2-YC6860]|uniref:Bug family tripartite tricarboxylate transporter substrate binding protein n=1 Tax=Rhodoplanes sp. Z2-YC6860 TaxID=674703 RepID=UPI00078E1395|nr:tripartite tricarboxylate transporter substrate binding protein [Rhodoplanes sp. Z2-YC6860]AMN41760.1 extra-cytoplasmic solute receptor protein [Rhodoplanes sp. Z2-YC6860]